MLEGIGPSRELPCICLQDEVKTFWDQQEIILDSLIKLQQGSLQFFNLCPVSDEIWYPAWEVIVTNPPKIYAEKRRRY